jgi:dTDP-N-acetylfucosamine:lipid II N-acetylfucosaminyltransferase
MINQFNQVNKSLNHFLVVSNSKKLIFINPKFDNFSSVNVEEMNSYLNLNKDRIQAIVFHGLNEEYKWEIINKYYGKIKLHWFFWGTDGYMLPSMRKGLLKKKTRSLKIEKTKVKFWMYKIYNNNGIYNFLYLKIRNLLKKDKLFFQKFEDSLMKLSSISAIPDDYEKLKKATKISIKNFPVNIGSIDSILTDKKKFKKKKIGNNILLGNSISLENNHLDAFESLKDFDLSGRKILVPLSYGESFEGLQRHLISTGSSIFTNKIFTPITDFMNRKEYNELLSSCSVAILNHNKQHAWGNILTLLYLGLKVFLNEKNPIYTYLINLNVVVFEMNSLSQENLDNKLTQIFIERNRKILNSNFGSEKVFQQTSLLINELVT